MDLGVWKDRRFRVKFACIRGHVTHGTAKLVNAVTTDRFVPYKLAPQGVAMRLAAILEIEQEKCSEGCPLAVTTVPVSSRLSRSFPITLIRDEPSTAEPEQYALIDYTNYRGERRMRRIKPIKIYFGTNDYHSDPQWLLSAIDVERDELRDFAMAKIHSWAPLPC